MERLIDVLRAFVRDGIGLTGEGVRLRLVAGRGASRTDAHRAMAVAHKGPLMALVDPAAIARALSLPAHVTITPLLAVVLVWAAAEREGFSTDEHELYDERSAVRQYEAGTACWLAELLAVEDVVTLRAGVARDGAAIAA